MKAGPIACAVLLCALPADGGNTLVLAPSVINVLAPLDSVPSQAALFGMFGPPPLAPDNPLVSIARDPTVDLGLALRAIRALPAYCPPAPQACGTGAVVHDTLLTLVDSYQTSAHTPADLLRLRAAVEALGATRSGLATDVTKLTPLLDNPSRDVRATVVRALRNICNNTAIGPLSVSLSRETTRQVQLAITTALQDLARCAN